MSVLRVAFAIQNAAYFKTLDAWHFFIGCYFDVVTLALLSLPLFLLLNPLSLYLGNSSKKILQGLVKVYLVLVGLLVLLLNSWDIAYFSYTQKRSGFSYFIHLLTGTETSSLAGEFLREVWWLPLVFIGLAFILWRQLTHFNVFAETVQKKKNMVRYFLMLGVVLVMGRGGVQLRPIGIVDATALSSLEHAPIVLNTAFTVLKTTDDGSSQLLTLHSERALQNLLPRKHKQVHTSTNNNKKVQT
jgi:hypothetical protein